MAFAAGQKITAAALNAVMFPPKAHAYQLVVQTLTTSVSAPITMTGEFFDTAGNHSTAVNTSRFTCSVAGTYKCYGQVAYDVNIVGDRAAHFRKNNVAIDSLPYGGAPAMNGTGLLAGIAQAGGSVALIVGDYVELFGTQNSGGNLNTFYSAGGTNSFWIIERIGD